MNNKKKKKKRRYTQLTIKTKCISIALKVLNSTLRIPRGGRQDVMLQFTIPFINQNIVRQGTSRIVQNPLYISLGVHGGSLACDDLNKKACDYTVSAFTKHDMKPTTGKSFTVYQYITKIMVFTKLTINTSLFVSKLDLQRVLAARSFKTLPYQIYRFHNTLSLA